MDDKEPQLVPTVSIRQQLVDAMLAGEAYNNSPDDSPEKHDTRERHLDRVKKFLNFEVEPNSDEKIDFIIVAGASPFIDHERYKARIEKSVALATEFPESTVIFSGRMPHESRRTGYESLSEAEMMATEAEVQGLARDRIIEEPDSNHLKENVEFSLRRVLSQIQESQETVGVAVVSSQTTIRRAYYSTLQLLASEFPGLEEKMKLYFIPSDDDTNDDGLVFYEMRRLLDYRRKGWL
jgi:hypothetical protein